LPTGAARKAQQSSKKRQYDRAHELTPVR
jgi:hypothetical protein